MCSAKRFGIYRKKNMHDELPMFTYDALRAWRSWLHVCPTIQQCGLFAVLHVWQS